MRSSYLVGSGADDGNRTRVFSLGSRFQAEHAFLKRPVRRVGSKLEYQLHLRFCTDWRTPTVQSGYGGGSFVFGVPTGYPDDPKRARLPG
jgi:hypothetical protein